MTEHELDGRLAELGPMRSEIADLRDGLNGRRQGTTYIHTAGPTGNQYWTSGQPRPV